MRKKLGIQVREVKRIREKTEDERGVETRCWWWRDVVVGGEVMEAELLS
jgi:hypothetical protein